MKLRRNPVEDDRIIDRIEPHGKGGQRIVIWLTNGKGFTTMNWDDIRVVTL